MLLDLFSSLWFFLCICGSIWTVLLLLRKYVNLNIISILKTILSHVNLKSACQPGKGGKAILVTVVYVVGLSILAMQNKNYDYICLVIFTYCKITYKGFLNPKESRDSKIILLTPYFLRFKKLVEMSKHRLMWLSAILCKKHSRTNLWL